MVDDCVFVGGGRGEDLYMKDLKVNCFKVSQTHLQHKIAVIGNLTIISTTISDSNITAVICHPQSSHGNKKL